MSLNIKKETYVAADEKTTKALTYDILNKLYERTGEMTKCHQDHVKTCGVRFKVLEDEDEAKGRKNTAKASASGFVGGFVAMGINFLREWVMK